MRNRLLKNKSEPGFLILNVQYKLNAERVLNLEEISNNKDLKGIIYELKDKMQIFQFVGNDEIEKIVPCFKIKAYPAGTVIFKEGDIGDFIGFVISGKLEVKKQTDFKGKQIVLALLGKGSFAGELSMIDGQSRTATIMALEDSALLILGSQTLNSFIERHPDTGVKILRGVIRTISIRLTKTIERLTSLF